MATTTSPRKKLPQNPAGPHEKRLKAAFTCVCLPEFNRILAFRVACWSVETCSITSYTVAIVLFVQLMGEKKCVCNGEILLLVLALYPEK